MKKLLIFLFFFNTYIFANSSVLIINSYHKGYEWSDKIVSGIEKTLYPHTELDINILYMDSKRIASKEYFTNLKKLYEVQLRDRKYDLIIVVDRFAYEFVLDIYDTVFESMPILTVGMEHFSWERAKAHGIERKISALLERRDLSDNIKLIEKVIPSIKKLYVINDKSINGKHTEPQIKDLLGKFHGRYELVYLREDSLKDLEYRFSKPEENSAILFIRFYKDSNGRLNKNQDIAKFIDNSEVPVFITDSIFNKKGAVGGRIVDLEKFGETSGEMAIDILKIHKYDLKVYEDLYYVFDAQKLDQFTLPIKHLSIDYEIVNKRLTFFDKNRGFIDFVFVISPVFVFLILGLFHNIYMRKNTEEKLRQRIEFDSVLLNAIESPIYWEDERGAIIDSNVKFCNFIQLPPKEIYGRKLSELIYNNKAIFISKVLKEYQKDKKQNSQFKFKLHTNDKRVYFIKQAFYCDSKTKKTGTVTIFTDVTIENEIEKEREKNQEFLVQQSKLAEIGEIFSSIAHQWKSPLVEITTIAQESFYNSDNTQREDESYVNDIMTQVNYMNNTINDFQNFIMPSNKKKNFDAKEAIDSMLEIVEHNIKYNYIKIDISLEKGTNLLVCGYRNEFMQSVLNIINNAKDELIKKDLKNRRIYIYFYNKDNKLFIRIEDNAGGINPSCIKKIFKPYYSTKDKGHGIGLYMVKMIIEDKMDGKIEVKNTKEGASFEIMLENVE